MYSAGNPRRDNRLDFQEPINDRKPDDATCRPRRTRGRSPDVDRERTACQSHGRSTLDGSADPADHVRGEPRLRILDTPQNTKLSVISINLAGHFVGPAGLGGYLAIPLTNVDVDFPLLGNDSELAFGNLEIGGLWAKNFGPTDLVLHGGVALPTADDDGVGAYQALGAIPRFGDFVQRVPDTSWLRLGASPMGRGGQFFWRADVGLDLALDDDTTAEISPVFHLSVGGGFDLGAAQLLLELVNVFTSPADDNADNSASTLTLGARFDAGSVKPGVGLLLPLANDDLTDDLDMALVVSLAILPTR